jgi:hypothetical protein
VYPDQFALTVCEPSFITNRRVEAVPAANVATTTVAISDVTRRGM